MKCIGCLVVLGAVLHASWAKPARAEDPPPRAARSVHLGWESPPAEWFYLEMTVRRSVPGSYFMACGWNTGYFGIQELVNDSKVVIFSVWDPTRGDDPQRVPEQQRVELVHQGPGTRIRRFGGEGTGGQCMAPLEWQLAKRIHLLVRATVNGEKTAYAGYLYDAQGERWQHLVTFRVKTGGQSLRGLYSFVEDFRRNYESARQQRSADFGHGWIRDLEGRWVPLSKARFTASRADWEAKETINAEQLPPWFRLTTGGDTQQTTPLRSMLQRDEPEVDGPPVFVTEFVDQQAAPETVEGS